MYNNLLYSINKYVRFKLAIETIGNMITNIKFNHVNMV